MSYPVNGKIKVVQFWHMRVIDGPLRELDYEIKSVKWLPLKQAIEALTRVHEKVFLANVGPLALKTIGPSVRDKSISEDKRRSRRSSIAPVEQLLAGG
jgi:8-oxo-dGTP diphosphatase